MLYINIIICAINQYAWRSLLLFNGQVSLCVSVSVCVCVCKCVCKCNYVHCIHRWK